MKNLNNLWITFVAAINHICLAERNNSNPEKKTMSFQQRLKLRETELVTEGKVLVLFIIFWFWCIFCSSPRWFKHATYLSNILWDISYPCLFQEVRHPSIMKVYWGWIVMAVCFNIQVLCTITGILTFWRETHIEARLIWHRSTAPYCFNNIDLASFYIYYISLPLKLSDELIWHFFDLILYGLLLLLLKLFIITRPKIRMSIVSYLAHSDYHDYYDIKRLIDRFSHPRLAETERVLAGMFFIFYALWIGWFLIYIFFYFNDFIKIYNFCSTGGYRDPSVEEIIYDFHVFHNFSERWYDVPHLQNAARLKKKYSFFFWQYRR